MRYKNNLSPIYCVSDRFRVVSSHDVCFSKNQKEIIACGRVVSSDSVSADNYVFSPSSELVRDVGILPAYSIVHITESMLPVRSLQAQPSARLKKGRTIGYVEAMDATQLAAIHPTPNQSTAPTSTPESAGNGPVIDLSHIGDTERQQLQELIDEFSDVFSTGEGDLGRTSRVVHRIPTGDAPPVTRRNYRQPHLLRQEAMRQVDNLLHQGVVEPSVSPWSAPVLMVPKKDGSYRFYVDFRGLNRVTSWSEYPIPRIDDCLESMSGAKIFTTLDLASGYWQVLLDPEDREKTAFSTQKGHFQFVTMPMGLKGAPATFQRLMDSVLRGLHWKSVLVYLDDIILFSQTFAEHLEHLREVFHCLRQAGLKLKPSKCIFVRPEVPFLGHVVSAEGVQTDPKKTETISTWPPRLPLQRFVLFLALLDTIGGL